MPQTNTKLGNAVKSARVMRGISEIEMASDLGISLMQLQDIEEGRDEKPGLGVLFMIALRLEMEPKDLYGGLSDNASGSADGAKALANLHDCIKELKRSS